MTSYTKTMTEALAEVRGLQENNMNLMRKAAGGAMQTLKMKDGKLQMDSFTASAIMQIFDKVNPANQKKMEQMINDGKKSGIIKLQKFAMSKVNAEYSEELELDEAKVRLYRVSDKNKQGNVHAKNEKEALKKAKEKGLKDPIKITDRGEYKGQPRFVSREETELDEGREKSGRQLVDPKREVMVVKKNKVVVIDKKDEDKYLKQGWQLAEEVDLAEGRMKELHMYISQGKSAEWIAKKMGVDVKTI